MIKSRIFLISQREKYINEEFYHIVRNFRNIDSSDIIIKKIGSDENYLEQMSTFYIIQKINITKYEIKYKTKK